MALVVVNSQDADPIRQDPIADGIREAFQMRLATAKGCQWKRLWVGFDQTHDTLQLVEKLVSQSSLALIIPVACLFDLPLDSPVVGQLHARRREAKCAMKASLLISWEGSRFISASRWFSMLSSLSASSSCAGSLTDSQRLVATRHRSSGLSRKAASMMDS